MTEMILLPWGGWGETGAGNEPPLEEKDLDSEVDRDGRAGSTPPNQVTSHRESRGEQPRAEL